MKRFFLVLLLATLLSLPLYLPSGGDRAAAAPPPSPPFLFPPSPFVGQWRAISPDPKLGDAHLSIRGRFILSLRLTDPFDRLFCGSGIGDPVAVSATGWGWVTAPRTLSVVYFYHCSDGTAGIGTTQYSFSPVGGTSTDHMVDTTGHLWTRIP